MSTNCSNEHTLSTSTRTETDYKLNLSTTSYKDALAEIERFVGIDKSFPKFVLMVIGDSTAFVPKHWQTSIFKAGIVEIAKQAQDCLILYEGTNKKISTLVEEAVNDFKKLQHNPMERKQTPDQKSENEKNDTEKCFVRLIGLVSNQSPSEHTDCSTDCAEGSSYTQIPKGPAQLFSTRHIQQEGAKLTKTTRRQKSFNSRLAKIAHRISKKWTPLLLLNSKESKEKDLYMRVPVVMIVAEGDLKTIRIACRILEKDIPVLIMKGSGKAADFIADFIEQDTEVNRKTIIAKTAQFFGIVFHERDCDRLEKNMGIIMQHKCLLTVLNINTNTETSTFTEAATNAVIVSWSERAHKEINNTDKDIRRKSITLHAISKPPEPLMEKYTSLKQKSTLPLYYYTAYQYINEIATVEEQTKDLEILLREAIIADQIEYVSILLREGVKFNNAYFVQLYKKTILPQFDDATDFQHILKWGPKKPREYLMEVKENDNLQNPSWQCVLAGRLICQSLLSYKKKEYNILEFEGQDVFSDLLIWAILANRPTLATLFWTKSCHQLLGALFVSSLYKTMAFQVKTEEQHSDYELWTEQERKFASIALSLQDKLYTDEPQMTMELLSRRETVWDIEASPLEFAHENKMYDIIAHKSSQRQLNSVWYSNMGASTLRIWKTGFFLGCCCCCPKGIRCWCLFDGRSRFKVHSFFNTPLLKFLVHYIFYMVALLCFSAFLLVELDAFSGVASIEGYEWLVYIYVVTDMAEEYRTLLRRLPCAKGEKTTKAVDHTLCYKLKKYLYDVWNFMDVISYTLVIIAVVFRFTPYINIKVVRRTYSVALFAMYMKFLRMLLMSRKLGPKIIMIKEMFKDLFRFIGILFVFMMGVGVLYHANMYPKHVDMWSQKGWEYWRIWKIISIPYWQIYGDSYLDAFEDNSTTPCTTNKSEWESNPEMERCSQYDPILVIVAALYMLVSNLLLVNLVIALFRHVKSDVDA